MTYRLDQLPAQPFLSDADQRRLIGIVQLAEHWRKLDGGTAQVEEAQERLVLAFLPAIKRAARIAKQQDPDDATAMALEEFWRAVMDFDLRDDSLPFHAAISIRMMNHITSASHEAGLIAVPHTTASRWWSILRAHDHDMDQAFAACRRGDTEMTSETFLAVYHALFGVDSMTPAVSTEGFTEEGHDGEYHRAGMTMAGSPVPGPEERVVEEHLVSWLFTLVDDRQESILRLIYGFTDGPTDSIRLLAGYPTGLDLSDAQAAHALGLSRPTVQRQKTNALRIMRAAMQELVDDDAV